MLVNQAGALRYGTPQHPVGSHETATIALPDCTNRAVVTQSRVDQSPNNQQSMPVPMTRSETNLLTAAFSNGQFLVPMQLRSFTQLTAKPGSETQISLN